MASCSAFWAFSNFPIPLKLSIALWSKSKPIILISISKPRAFKSAATACKSPPQDSSPSVTNIIKRFSASVGKSSAAAKSEIAIGVAPIALASCTVWLSEPLSTPFSSTNNLVSSQALSSRAEICEP